jgi:hypothetical protein
MVAEDIVNEATLMVVDNPFPPLMNLYKKIK